MKKQLQEVVSKAIELGWLPKNDGSGNGEVFQMLTKSGYELVITVKEPDEEDE